jgi:hypothetical protein
MRLYIDDEIEIDYDYDPGEKGATENGAKVTQDIPESIQVNGIVLLGKELSQATMLAILHEFEGKIQEQCMVNFKRMQETSMHPLFEDICDDLKRGSR